MISWRSRRLLWSELSESWRLSLAVNRPCNCRTPLDPSIFPPQRNKERSDRPKAVGIKPLGAVGPVVFDPERVVAFKQKGKQVILVRETAETSDIEALSQAAALITAEGARTSHAAVVARQLGKVCIVGCEGLSIEPSGRAGIFGAATIEEGQILSVDGIKGEIYRGTLEIVAERPTELLSKIELWHKTEGVGTKRRHAHSRKQR